jgi:hypothetical protein
MRRFLLFLSLSLNDDGERQEENENQLLHAASPYNFNNELTI